ncbi:YeeE/YedE family protein [Arsenicitalea aurantiaca]|uniref:YeeE/YedE family protein n=1 Tax=Arsenicitalea aurantiaca TaxID=1783274 RepID=A0A433X5H9_9HYPH|nr:YeeE/YedE family protein [Arsenicitalea aurantiaca]RUT29301.1 YeeE/YedE family protein [Arsenicitalea aurantiaca]
MPQTLRYGLAALIVLVILWGVWTLNAGGVADRPLAISLILGSAFGLVLQRSRFCFYCNLRDLVERREPAGVLAILVALAIGAIGYTAIFGAWLPTPAIERLPPTAHIGPVSLVLVGAALIFGLGMGISGSCLSAHFYRLGEGSPVAPFAIIGAAAGFGIGFYTWNELYLTFMQTAPSAWMPHALGYAGSLVLTLLLLAGLALLALWWGRPRAGEPLPPLTVSEAFRRLFVLRWPATFAGAAVGVISILAYFRVAPLGVTAELGSIVRTGAASLAVLPERLVGLDGFRGCATVIKEALLSNNGLFVLGLIFTAFASALIANQFTPRLPNVKDVFRGLAGGVLLGWGAMTALGCTVGVLLSGIHAGAVSGWVFLGFCALGAILSMPIGRRLETRSA